MRCTEDFLPVTVVVPPKSGKATQEGVQIANHTDFEVHARIVVIKDRKLLGYVVTQQDSIVAAYGPDGRDKADACAERREKNGGRRCYVEPIYEGEDPDE